MSRWLKISLAATVGLLVISAVAYLCLTRSESGLRWALQLASSDSQPLLRFQNPAGSIHDGIRLQQFRYADAGSRILASGIEGRLGFRLLPLRLTVEKLKIAEIRIETNPVTGDGGDGDYRLPLRIQIKQLQIDDLEYTDPDLALRLGQTTARLDLGQSLRLGNFESRLLELRSGGGENLLQGLSLGLQAHGDASLRPPYKHQLGVQLQVSGDGPEPWRQLLTESQFRIDSKGSLQRLELNASSQGRITLELNADLRQLAKDPRWQVRLHSEPLELPVDTGVRLRISDLEVNSKGRLEDWSLDSSALLQTGNDKQTPLSGNWKLVASGNRGNIQINAMTLDGDIGQLHFTGSVDAGKPMVDGLLDWSQLQLAGLVPEWPAKISSSGHGKIHYRDNEVVVEDLQARLDQTEASVDGRLALNTETIEARLNWRQLRWPPAGPEPRLRSEQGRIEASGSPDQWQLKGEFQLAGKQIPPGNYRLDGGGNRTSAQIHSLNGSLLGGRLRLTGDLQWQPRFTTDLTLHSDGLDPGLYWDDYPGQIDAILEARYNDDPATGQPRLTLQIQRLEGQLQGFPIQFGGRVDSPDGQIYRLDINGRSGSATIHLNGKLDTDALFASEGEFQLDIPDLGELLAAGQGQLQASGKLEQRGGASRFKLHADGQGIEAEGLGSQRLAVDLAGILPTAGSGTLQIDGSVKIEDLTVSGFDRPFQTLEFEARSKQDDSLDLQLQTRLGDHDIVLAAGTTLTVREEQLTASGELRNFDYSNPVIGKVALEAPAVFAYSGGALSLAPACFRQSPDDLKTRVCLAREPAGENTRTTLSLEDFPLAWITAWLPLDLAIGQGLDGSLEILGETELTSVHSLRGDFDISAGRITPVTAAEDGIATSPGKLTFHYLQQQQLGARLEIPFEVGEGIHLDLTGQLADEIENLSGSLRVSLNDLSVIRWMIPGLDRLDGSLETDLRLSGSRQRPQLAGDLDIAAVNLDYAPLGAEIRDLSLAGKLDSHDESVLSGDFKAGEGEADIRLRLSPGNPVPALDLTLRGENLRLLNAPGLKLTASPDIEARLQGRELRLDGKIRIPRARIRPLPGMLASASISPDVVVTGLAGEAQATAEKPLPLRIFGNLRIDLGESVEFRMDSVETRLSGGMDLAFDGQSAVPAAEGAIELVDGYFQQYGQNLSFEDSSIHFDGKPVTNPKLEIYAVRHIFADPEVELAGVKVSGRPDNIDIRLYTDPETDQETAVAYIATGSNFDHGNGVGALNIGTYLYPKLFVSYGIGLFDNGNMVSARYELNRHWAVQATSSDSESGIDILYSIDR